MRLSSSACLLLVLSMTTAPSVAAEGGPQPLVIVLWGESDTELVLQWTITGGIPDVLKLIRENKDGREAISLNVSQETYVEAEVNLTATYWIYAEADGYVSISNLYHGGCQMLVDSSSPPYQTVRAECIPIIPVVPKTLQRTVREVASQALPP